jgi:hypothetical protein
VLGDPLVFGLVELFLVISENNGNFVSKWIRFVDINHDTVNGSNHVGDFLGWGPIHLIDVLTDLTLVAEIWVVDWRDESQNWGLERVVVKFDADVESSAFVEGFCRGAVGDHPFGLGDGGFEKHAVLRGRFGPAFPFF